jgi:hypothetical protein
MFTLIALICVLDSTPRGHRCDVEIYPKTFHTLTECRQSKTRWAMRQKMVLGDCIRKKHEN